MVWLMILTIYIAPDDAVDWDGPWKLGNTHLVEKQYGSEAECRNSAIQLIGKLREGMLAPIRFKCVAVSTELPAGAPR